MDGRRLPVGPLSLDFCPNDVREIGDVLLDVVGRRRRITSEAIVAIGNSSRPVRAMVGHGLADALVVRLASSHVIDVQIEVVVATLMLSRAAKMETSIIGLATKTVVAAVLVAGHEIVVLCKKGG